MARTFRRKQYKAFELKPCWYYHENEVCPYRGIPMWKYINPHCNTYEEYKEEKEREFHLDWGHRVYVNYSKSERWYRNKRHRQLRRKNKHEIWIMTHGDVEDDIITKRAQPANWDQW